MLYPMSLHPFHLEPGGSSIMVVHAEPEGIHKVPTSPGLGEGGVVLALKGTSGNAELGEKSTGAASAQEATKDADVVLRQIGPGFLRWPGLFCLKMASWQDCQATPVLFPGPGRLGRAQGAPC